MKIKYAFLARHAESENGVFNVIGGDIDSVSTSAFPCLLPGLSLLIKIDCDVSDLGTKSQLTLEIVSPSGEVRQGNRQTISVEAKPTQGNPAMPGSILLQFSYVAISFEKPGRYIFRLLTDSAAVLTEVPLTLTQDAKVDFDVATRAAGGTSATIASK